ncbi:MAG: hypothetical protein AB3N11_01545 [Arenibacterium sp.]
MTALPPLDRWQYRLVSAPSGQDGVNHSRQIAGSHLETGADLPVHDITDASGARCGVLIGHPLHFQSARTARRVEGAVQLGAQLGADVDSFVEAGFQELAGRFLWIFESGTLRRVYPDCAGQIPCVFDVEAGRIGATAHALLGNTAYTERFDQGLYDRVGIEGLGWFPGGVTAHSGLTRLLPNHFLDLADFSVHRHWPTKPLGESADPTRDVFELAKLVHAQIAALTELPDRRVAQALTAGRETRMLLGCARDIADKLDFVTVSAGGAHQTDTVMARRIVAAEHLSHRALPRQTATSEERAAYLRRGGHCVADANANYFPSVRPIADTHVFIGGAGGEIGRGFFWRPGDTRKTKLTGAGMVNRFGLSAEPRLVTAMDTWLEGLAGHDSLQILDLAYIEQRMGPWSGPQFCCDPTLVRFAPLLSRSTATLMLGFPEDWKRNEGMADAILHATWPELLRFPFNSLGAVQDMLGKVGRVNRDPGLILRKLRKKRL